MRQTTIFTLLLASIMSVALFYLKYEVTDLERYLNNLNRAIVTNQETIHVLNAEWSHLNDVSRIKDLAKRYLQILLILNSKAYAGKHWIQVGIVC
jgi:hypothetical protein